MRDWHSVSRFITKKSDLSALGVHIAYTILYVYKNNLGDKPLEYLIRVKPFKFVHMYENACNHLGFQPVVSVSSGHGIYDYKTYLHRWYKLFREWESYKKM